MEIGTTKAFIDYIRQIINQEINKQNFIKTYSGTVISVSIDGKRATVRLTGSDEDIPNLLNKTGETLSVDDNVFLFAMNNNFSNLVIGMRFGEAT